MCIAGRRVEPGVGASGIRLLFPPVESLGALTRFKFWSLDDVSKPVKYLEKGVDIHKVKKMWGGMLFTRQALISHSIAPGCITQARKPEQMRKRTLYDCGGRSVAGAFLMANRRPALSIRALILSPL